MDKVILEEKLNIDTSSAWESYWNRTSELSNPIFWDCKPELAADRDLPRFKNKMDSQFPLIDFACGNGTQTRFLANYFTKVIGIDVSESAVKMAKAKHNAPNIEYRVLDALKPEQAEALHSEIGDVNIYMRTGFHHIPVDKRSEFAKSLQILLGNKGIIYLIELGANAINYWNSVREKYGKLPEEMNIVLEHGIRPGTVALEDIVNLFRDFEVLESGEDYLHIAFPLPDGNYPKVPTFYAAMKHK
ncbi:class I SAM-dependent methyltransferase [Rivularia sp. UHCC 0363]|uniref:class I SAM-dependent methyltransferase n=1 Tax=Rivularia sp. UHCC 0363 TaxID=3110244 RepID=UPI002B1F34B9|nr:class I SAM-dependent methyltransferase [Rivularia sp. UHCC 0363]MEA5594228.1 class I SAM-dependent methyltransferase [Rivularia sp. UHCC 0363]